MEVCLAFVVVVVGDEVEVGVGGVFDCQRREDGVVVVVVVGGGGIDDDGPDQRCRPYLYLVVDNVTCHHHHGLYLVGHGSD